MYTVSLKLSALTVATVFMAASAMAQEPSAIPDTPKPPIEAGAPKNINPSDDSHSVIQINQPFSAKKLGNLTLPFMWDVQEDEKVPRLVATETRTVQPAILTMDLLAIPEIVKGEKLAQSIAQSIADGLGTTADVTPEPQPKTCDKKGNCTEITLYRSSFAGKENGVQRRCAIEIMHAGTKAVVLTICGLESRSYEPDLPDVLNQVLAGMQ